MRILIIAALLFSVFLCKLSASDIEMSFDFDFSRGHEEWVGDFTDYPEGEESFYELAWGWTDLPKSLPDNNGKLEKGMFLKGHNHSDDLFMFVKRQIKDLAPNTEYVVYFNVTIENDIPPGTYGIGGSPGESVFFKVGASQTEPKKISKNGFYNLNVDKGDQSQGGENAVVAGTMENSHVNPDDKQYEAKTITNTEILKVTTNEKGELWIFLGTDSGFEGITQFYIAKIHVDFFNLF